MCMQITCNFHVLYQILFRLFFILLIFLNCLYINALIQDINIQIQLSKQFTTILVHLALTKGKNFYWNYNRIEIYYTKFSLKFDDFEFKFCKFAKQKILQVTILTFCFLKKIILFVSSIPRLFCLPVKNTVQTAGIMKRSIVQSSIYMTTLKFYAHWY